MRHLHFLALAAIVMASACNDFKEVMKLSTAVHKQYHMPAAVTLHNRNHLTITFKNVSVDSLKLDSTGMEGFAREVAAFAKAHYSKADRLEDVAVAFATVSKTGPLTTTRTNAPYRFLIRELP